MYWHSQGNIAPKATPRFKETTKSTTTDHLFMSFEASLFSVNYARGWIPIHHPSEHGEGVWPWADKLTVATPSIFSRVDLMVSGSVPWGYRILEGQWCCLLGFHQNGRPPAFMLNGPILASVWAILIFTNKIFMKKLKLSHEGKP